MSLARSSPVASFMITRVWVSLHDQQQIDLKLGIMFLALSLRSFLFLATQRDHSTLTNFP